MLHTFLIENRGELIERCRRRAQMRAPAPDSAPTSSGIALFVDQLTSVLKAMLSVHPQDAVPVAGDRSGRDMRTDIGASAALIGKTLLSLGLTVDEVVHNYGDVCQAITDLAVQERVEFSVEEYRTLNRCLDHAIAHAVAEFSYQRDYATAEEVAQQASQRFGHFLVDLRQLLGTATLAFSAARTGALTVTGATGAILERSLNNIGKLIDNFSDDLQHGPRADILHVYSLADLIAEVQATAELAATARQCKLAVPPVAPELGLIGKRDLLFAALVNLLQNAFDYTRPQTTVTLNAYGKGDRILIEVLDQCGGLDAEAVRAINAESKPPAHQRDELGLTLARRFVAANDGVLTMQNLADVGCMFSVSLPRHAMPA